MRARGFRAYLFRRAAWERCARCGVPRGCVAVASGNTRNDLQHAGGHTPEWRRPGLTVRMQVLLNLELQNGDEVPQFDERLVFSSVPVVKQAFVGEFR